MSKRKKVALGLSGGVDSSVSAKILLDLGYQVTAVYLNCFNEPGCRSDEDRQDALKVALSLGLTFQSLDFQAEYRQKVLDYLYQSYRRGETPNPDLLCNREIKFGLFYDWALAQDFDLVATGHYARIKNKKLYTAQDKIKDQTYFLALVAPAKWERTLFPVGKYTKKQVRALAQKWQLPTAAKKDSTGMCFVGEVSWRNFLNRKIKRRSGPVIWRRHGQQTVVGEHEGAAFYTLGQRHGFKLHQNQTRMPVLYVLGKDLVTNELWVGERQQLLSTNLTLKISPALMPALTQVIGDKYQSSLLKVRIRHQGELVPIKQITMRAQSVQIDLTEAVFAPSPGQFAVFYQSDPDVNMDYYCLGAGVII
jgi:tRNA-specific 2-thiouridylase